MEFRLPYICGATFLAYVLPRHLHFTNHWCVAGLFITILNALFATDNYPKSENAGKTMCSLEGTSREIKQSPENLTYYVQPCKEIQDTSANYKNLKKKKPAFQNQD